MAAERYYIHRCGEGDAFALTAQTRRDCVKRRRRIEVRTAHVGPRAKAILNIAAIKDVVSSSVPIQEAA